MRISDNNEFVERCGLQNDNDQTYYILHDLNANVRLTITPILPFTLKDDYGKDLEIERIDLEYTSHREKCLPNPNYQASTLLDNNLNEIDLVLSEHNFHSLGMVKTLSLCYRLKDFWMAGGYPDLYMNAPLLVANMKRNVLCV